MEEKKYGPYSEKVIDHFRNPRNMGEMKDADAISKVGSPICGDELWIYIKVDKNEDGELYLKDIKFESFGCAGAVATGSMMTELAKGKTLKEALKINRNSVAEALGGLPKVKLHCSLLSTDALHEAIYLYMKKNNIPIPNELQGLHVKVEKGTAIAKVKQESGKDYC